MAAPWYRWDGDALILDLHIQPRATKNEIVGPHGARLKIRLTSPPVDGKANAALIAFLAAECQVPRAAVQLTQGETGRQKRVRIIGPRVLPTGVPPA